MRLNTVIEPVPAILALIFATFFAAFALVQSMPNIQYTPLIITLPKKPVIEDPAIFCTLKVVNCNDTVVKTEVLGPIDSYYLVHGADRR